MPIRKPVRKKGKPFRASSRPDVELERASAKTPRRNAKLKGLDVVEPVESNNVHDPDELPLFEKSEDTTGSAQIQRIRCSACASYYNITWKDQQRAASYLESIGFDVKYLGDGSWKVKESNATGAREEILHPKGLIGRANFYRHGGGNAKIQSKAKRVAHEEETTKRPSKRSDAVEVPPDNGRPVEPVRRTRMVGSDTDKRRRERKGTGSDGSRTRKAVRKPATRSADRTRAKAAPVRESRPSAPRVQNRDGASKKALERRRKYRTYR